jgi:uncharacterized protein
MKRLIVLILIVAVVFGFIYVRNERLRAKQPHSKRVAVKPIPVKIVPAKKAPTAKQVPPASVKAPEQPTIAIVIDDFGYTMANMNTLLGMKEPVTLSVLPNLKYSREVARLAKAKGDEVILHLPMESQRKDVGEEPNTIKTSMDERTILSKLDADLAAIPGIDGVSNHMGSKATENSVVMTAILKRLRQKNLFYFDSLTSEKSVCGECARRIGVRYARRNIFLDNNDNVDYIRKQFLVLKSMALKNDVVIAICHDRKNSIKVLSEMAPELTKEGVRFVRLSELVK